MRRLLLALTVSLAAHLMLVAGAIGVGAWQALSLVPAVRLQPISVEVNELPLGPPPVPAAQPEDEPRAPRPARRRAPARPEGVAVAARADAGVEPARPDARTAARPIDGGAAIDGGRRRPGDLRESGPAGSRLNAILRLDRIRASTGGEATIAAIDQLLVLLPDRKRLIEGSGLDLYRDFDSLLIATPNPMDDAVTFLAVRHHLSDAALKAGLERGAKAANKPIEWMTVGGRPVGLRRRPSAGQQMLDRDDRILALPQTSLAVMATPAYAGHLLDTELIRKPAQLDGGQPDAATRARKPVSRARWQSLVSLIEGAENALPDDAVFMMMATGLFGAVERPTGYVVPSTRGASDDQPVQPVGTTARPPSTMTVIAGLEPALIEINAEFATVADAQRWERDLPAWRRKLITNPAVILSGFASLLGRLENSRDGGTIRLRVETSVEELQRLLNLAVNLTRTATGRAR